MAAEEDLQHMCDEEEEEEEAADNADESSEGSDSQQKPKRSREAADSSESEEETGAKAPAEAKENPLEQKRREDEERRKQMEKLEKRIAKAELKVAKQEVKRQRKKKKQKAKKRRHEESDEEEAAEEDEDDASNEAFWAEVVRSKKGKQKAGRGKNTKKPAQEADEAPDATDAAVPLKGGPKARAKKRAKEPKAESQVGGAAPDKPGDEASGLEKAPKRGRRCKKAGEEATGNEDTRKPPEGGDATPNAQGGGRRGRKTGDDGGKSAQREEGINVLLDWGDDLEEPDEVVLQSWQQELGQRRDSGSIDDRTAFSMRERGSMLRTLKPECFLGGKRLEEGGHLLYDDEGKVNLHFLLATVKTATAAGALTALKPASAHRAKLRWLASLALEMRLIGKQELKRGKLQAKRMEQARKNGNYSLLLESNLVSDRRTEDAEGRPTADVATGAFPERAPAEASNESNRAGRQTVFSSLRSQAVRRQAKIITSASHQLDLQKVQALIGPSFSFDWEAKGDGEEDELEVDIPESDKQSSGRNIMKDQLQRSVSFRQLSKSMHSSQSLGAVSTTPTASQELAASNQAPAPPAPTGALARRVLRRGAAVREPQEAAAENEPVASSNSGQAPPAAPAVATKVYTPDAASETTLPQDEACVDRFAVKDAAPQESPKIVEHESTLAPGEDPSSWATQPLPEESEPEHRAALDGVDVLPPLEALHTEQVVRKEVIISPTLPFEPCAAAPPPQPARKVLMEISPTLPFEPQAVEPEEEPPSGAGALEADPAAGKSKGSQRPLAERAPDQEAYDLLSAEIEDPLMDEEALEAETETDRRRVAEEREWLKHKRRLELGKRAAAHEQAMKKQAVGGKDELGISAMTAEEKSRYQALVSDMPLPAAEASDALLGSRQNAFTAPTMQRKPSFVALLARKFSRSASDRSLAGAGA